MLQFSHQSVIAATPDLVWATLADISNWPRWTPTVLYAQVQEPGFVDVGSCFRIRQPKMLPAVWRITSWAPDREFVWVSSGIGFLATAEHILSNQDGGTLLTLRLTLEGVLAPLVGCLAGTLAQKYLALEATGLKRHVESQCSGKPR